MEEWFECSKCRKRFSSEAHEEFVEAEKCPCGGHLEPACPRCHRAECTCGDTGDMGIPEMETGFGGEEF